MNFSRKVYRGAHFVYVAIAIVEQSHVETEVELHRL
jgi:hypothetical protein